VNDGPSRAYSVSYCQFRRLIQQLIKSDCLHYSSHDSNDDGMWHVYASAASNARHGVLHTVCQLGGCVRDCTGMYVLLQHGCGA
jgi:hypothetical protein